MHVYYVIAMIQNAMVDSLRSALVFLYLSRYYPYDNLILRSGLHMRLCISMQVASGLFGYWYGMVYPLKACLNMLLGLIQPVVAGSAGSRQVTQIISHKTHLLS